MQTKTKLIIAIAAWVITAIAIFAGGAWIGRVQTDDTDWDLSCGLGTDGSGPTFTGVDTLHVNGDVWTLRFIEGGQTIYKMRAGEYCIPKTAEYTR